MYSGEKLNKVQVFSQILLLAAILACGLAMPAGAATTSDDLKFLENIYSHSMLYTYDVMPVEFDKPQGLSSPNGRVSIKVQFFADDDSTPVFVLNDKAEDLAIEFEKYFYGAAPAHTGGERKTLGEKLKKFHTEFDKIQAKKGSARDKETAMESALKTLNSSYKSIFVDFADDLESKTKSKFGSLKYQVGKDKKAVKFKVTVELDEQVLPVDDNWFFRLFRGRMPTKEEALAGVPRFTFAYVSGSTTDGRTLTLTVTKRFLQVDYPNLDEPLDPLVFTFQIPVDVDDNTLNFIYHDLVCTYLSEEVEKFNVKVRACNDAITDLYLDPDRQTKAEALIAALNSDYTTTIDAIKSSLQTKIQEKVTQLYQRRSDNLKYNVIVGLKTAKSTFGIASNIARLVATGGADVTAWFGVANGIVDVFKVMKANFADIETSRTKVQEKLAKVTEEMDKHAADDIEALFRQKDIIAALDEAESAVTEFNTKINRLNTKVNNMLLTLLELLEVQDSMTSEMKTEFEPVITKTNALIEKIIDLNLTLKTNLDFTDSMLETVAEARQAAGMQNDGAIKSFIKFKLASFNATKTLAGVALEQVGVSDEFLTAAENLYDACDELHKKYKAKKKK